MERDHGLAPLDHHLVDGLDLVHRVHGAPRVALLHFAPVDVELGGTGQAVEAGDVLIVGRVAPEVLVVDDGQMALLDGHPSELAVVGMDHGALARLPAHGHQLEGLVAEDEVPRVHVVAKVEVAVEGPGVDRRLQAELEHTIPSDRLSLERFQVVDVLADRQELLAHVFVYGQCVPPPAAVSTAFPAALASRPRPTVP